MQMNSDLSIGEQNINQVPIVSYLSCNVAPSLVMDWNGGLHISIIGSKLLITYRL